MNYVTQPKDYWIAPNAVYITRNALGEPDRIQGSVASGASILCYIKGVRPASDGEEYAANGDGLEYDNGHNYKRWPITLSPTYFADHLPKYVYVAIPRSTTVGTEAVFVFPSERLDIYGMNAAGNQVGSVNFFYIFLQGILSSSGDDGLTERVWTSEIKFGSLSTDEALADASLFTDWYRYSTVSQKVTFLKNILMADGVSFENLRAEMLELAGKTLSSVANDATPVDSQTAVVTPYYASSKFLSKVNPDTAAGLITFLRGIALGQGYGITEEGIATLQSVVSDNFVPDLLLGTGWGAWLDENGISTIEVDNLNVRMKAIFSELEIRKISHSGGNLLFTAAGSKIQKVTPVDTNGNETSVANAVAFRCDLFSDDGTTATMNDWMVGDQARCQMFNIKEGVYQNVSNRSYWRKVIATEERYDDNDRLINSVIIAKNATGTYKNVAFTNGVSNVSSDYPQDGDTIVQLGNQINAERQNAIELVTNGNNAPALLKYQGINDYTLDGKMVQGEYYDPARHVFYSKTYGNWYVGARENDTEGGYAKYDEDTRTFSVKGKLEVGSTLEDGRDVNALGTARGNLLRNTGFTGDYESVDVESETLTVTENTPIYSDPLKYWDATNVQIVADESSASGFSAHIGTLHQSVESGMTEGEWYMLSMTISGNVTLTCGNESKIFTSNEWQRIDWAFIFGGNAEVTIQGEAGVREIILTAGNLPCEWRKSASDNDRSMAEFFGMSYLRDAITGASTNIIGGLIMSQILKVGNYRDGQMTTETGGMSGAMNDEKSPFLWGGGTMEDAIYTIMKYARNPAYQPTDAEVARMAKFVVTHGGRAILNDIILRGYIYALGGVFNGTVHATAGEFGGEDNLYRFKLSADEKNITISGPTLVDENGDPIEGAEMVEYMRIGRWQKRMNTGGQGYRITPMIQSRSLGRNLTTAITMTLNALDGLIFVDGNEDILARYMPFMADLPSVIYMKDLPTSDTNLSTGQIWNDNGTLKIKQ